VCLLARTFQNGNFEEESSGVSLCCACARAVNDIMSFMIKCLTVRVSHPSSVTACSRFKHNRWLNAPRVPHTVFTAQRLSFEDHTGLLLNQIVCQAAACSLLPAPALSATAGCCGATFASPWLSALHAMNCDGSFASRSGRSCRLIGR
jgi:hypothetical protein